MCNRTSGWQTAINQFQGDGKGVGKGMQVMLNQDGGVEEAIKSTGVDQRRNGDRRLARDKEMHPENKVTRGGMGEGGG